MYVCVLACMCVFMCMYVCINICVCAHFKLSKDVNAFNVLDTDRTTLSSLILFSVEYTHVYLHFFHENNAFIFFEKPFLCRILSYYILLVYLQCVPFYTRNIKYLHIMRNILNIIQFSVSVDKFIQIILTYLF